MLSRIRGALRREFHTCTFELVYRREVHKAIEGWRNRRHGVTDFLQCVDPRCLRRETESIYEWRVTDADRWEQAGLLPPHEERWALEKPHTKRTDGSKG